VRVVLNVESVCNIIVDIRLVRINWELVLILEDRVTLLLNMWLVVFVLELEWRWFVIVAVIFGSLSTFSTFTSFSTFSAFLWSGLFFPRSTRFTALGTFSFTPLSWSWGWWSWTGSADLFLSRLSLSFLSSLGSWISLLLVVVILIPWGEVSVLFRILIVPMRLFQFVSGFVINIVIIMLILRPGPMGEFIEMRVVIVTIWVVVVIIFRNLFDWRSTPVSSDLGSLMVFHHIVPCLSVMIVIRIRVWPFEFLSVMWDVRLTSWGFLSWLSPTAETSCKIVLMLEVLVEVL
jgi:hypothetical protein